ncbi:hypothetical protein EIKCOROL_00575 [Eikenella corrodens ATCC 23834]|uniref:Uncharacterized protein n=1 Tax=Eikenella corrodens ATCC 23834 TaxID=546274 RepID=C0DT97_EIKCO|nr:hypothetical protein EIKCOROL_00575 [Eikenella corrodens ATCC 23834]
MCFRQTAWFESLFSGNLPLHPGYLKPILPNKTATQPGKIQPKPGFLYASARYRPIARCAIMRPFVLAAFSLC